MAGMIARPAQPARRRAQAAPAPGPDHRETFSLLACFLKPATRVDDIYSRPVDSRRGVLHGLHVLVVEDDRDAREILKSVLAHFGALVTAARTAKEALTSLRQIRPDVVVTDMLLGTTDGVTLLHDARRDQSAGAPFIAVSGADF